MKISFIVPVLDGTFLTKTVQSLFSQDLHDKYEVIVVNNGSKSNTHVALLQLKTIYPELIILNCKTKGPSAARNLGAKSAHGTYFAFIDADVILPRNWAATMLSEMLDLFEVASCSIIPNGPSSFLTRFRRTYRERTSQGTFIVSYPSYTEGNNVPAINTAACIIQGKLFHHLGGFSEELKRGEDTHFSLKAYLYGAYFCFTTRTQASVYYSGGILSYLGRSFKDGKLHPYSSAPSGIKAGLKFELFLALLKFMLTLGRHFRKLEDAQMSLQQRKKNLTFLYQSESHRFALSPLTRLIKFNDEVLMKAHQFEGKCEIQRLEMNSLLNGEPPRGFSHNFFLDLGRSLLLAFLFIISSAYAVDDAPVIEFHGKSAINKDIIFSVITTNETPGCHLFILSPEGKTKFYRRLEDKCSDFRPHKINGKVYYSYLEVTQSMMVGGLFGKRVILDKEMNFVSRSAIEIDFHEFLLLDLDHTITFEPRVGRLSNGFAYHDKRLIERKSGEVIFDWGVSDFIKEVKTEAASYNVLFDYHGEVLAEILHLNSIQRIGEEKLLVGLGSNGIALLNKKTKSMEWILGGLSDQFSLTIDQHLPLIHTPYFNEDKGELTVYSNFGSPKEMKNPFTEIVRYKLDLKNKKVKSFARLWKGQEVAILEGGMDFSGNTFSISLGNRRRGKRDFVEVYRGKETASFKFQKQGYTVYRIYRGNYDPK